MNKEDEEIEAEQKNIDVLFEGYRKSGLTLMTAVVSLSSGGFFGLFQIKETRELSFLYLIPITIALMQQLTYYFGSRSLAISKRNRLWFEAGYFNSEGDQIDMGIDASISYRHSNLYFGLSDVFCLLAALSLGFITIWPMALYSSPLVGMVFSGSIALSLGYWGWRWFRVYRDIKNTVW